jgi:hypothetical protein
MTMNLFRSQLMRCALGVGLLAGGVASAIPENAPAIGVQLWRTSYNLRFSGNDVLSSGVQLHLDSGSARGRIGGLDAQHTLKDDKITGVVGGQHTNLKVKKEGDTLKAEGGFLGKRVELRYSPTELHAYMTGCTYDLKYVEGVYEGRRSCDVSLAPPVRVTVPNALAERTPSEQSLLLLLALWE